MTPCNCAGTAPGYPQHESYCGQEPDECDCFPHGPEDPCACNGCWACDGRVVGCTCDIAWDCEHRGNR